MNHLPVHLPRPTQRQHGFTLVEMVVTIALLAVITTLAVPSFTETLRAWRRDSATRVLLGSMQLARAEAIKSSRKVYMCASSDGETCSDSNDWTSGWFVWVERDNADGYDKADDKDGPPIQVVGALGGIESLLATEDEGGDEVTELHFLGNGLLGPLPAFNFVVTPSGASSSTKVDEISVTAVGRAHVDTKLP